MKHYGLLGGKLGHSLSPQIHELFFKYTGIEGDYTLLETTQEDLPKRMEELRANYAGSNVTIPHKLHVMPLLDSIAREAKAIGAVNTIKFDENGAEGYNTDYFGFGRMLEYNNIDVRAKRVAVLGTGGAARAVVKYMADKRVGKLYLVTRDVAHVDKDFLKIAPKCKFIDYDGLAALTGDVIVNCTPVGMYPKVNAAPVTPEEISNFDAAVDLIYNPKQTLFLKQAAEAKMQTVNGLFMLVAQAVAAQEIWQGENTTANLSSKSCRIWSRLYENIVLIGMPGCGKSTFGKRMAKRLQLPFYDADSVLEEREQRTIKAFFAESEEAFRAAETRTLAYLAECDGAVIATGGGAVKRAENMELLKRSGVVVLSTASRKTSSAVLPEMRVRC